MINNIIFYFGMALLTMIPIFAAIIIFSDDEPPLRKKSHHRKTKHKISRKQHAH